MPGRYHERYGFIKSYQWLLDQRNNENAPEGSFPEALQEYTSNAKQLQFVADTWAESWPSRKRLRLS